MLRTVTGVIDLGVPAQEVAVRDVVAETEHMSQLSGLVDRHDLHANDRRARLAAGDGI